MAEVLLRWIHGALGPSSGTHQRDRRAALAILDKLPTHLTFSPRLVKTLAACFVDTLDTDPLSTVSASLFRLILHHPSLHRAVHIGPIDVVAFVTEYLQALAAHAYNNDDGDDLDDNERRFCASLLCSIRRSPLRDAILHHPAVLPRLCDPAQHTEASWCHPFLRCPSPALFEALLPAIEAHLRDGNPEVAWTVFSTAPKDQQHRHRPWLLERLPLLLHRIPGAPGAPSAHAHVLSLCQFVAAYDVDMQAMTPDRWNVPLDYLAAHAYAPVLSRAVLTAALRQRWPASDLDRLMQVLFRTDWVLLDATWMDGLNLRVDRAFRAAAATYLLHHFLRGADAGTSGLRRRAVLLRFLCLVMTELPAPLPGVLDMFQESAVLRPQWTARVLAHVGPIHAHHLRKVLQFLLLHVDPQVISFPFEAAAKWLDMGVEDRFRLPLQDIGEAMTALLEEQWGDDEVVARVLAHHAPQRTLTILRRMLQSHSLVAQQVAVEYLQRLRGLPPYRDEGWPDVFEDTLYRAFCAGWYARAQAVQVQVRVKTAAAAEATAKVPGIVLRDHVNGTYSVRLHFEDREEEEVRVVHFMDMAPDLDVPDTEVVGKALLLSLWTDATRDGIKLPLTHHRLFMHLLAHHDHLLDETLEDAFRTLLCALGDARCPRFRVHLHRFLETTAPSHVPSILFRVLGHVRRAVGEPREIDGLLRTFQSAPPALASLVTRHQSIDPPLWLVTAMIEHSPGGVSALAKSRISPACLWRRLGEYVRSRPHPVLRDLRHKHNFLHAVLFARRIAYYGASGSEIPIPPAETPFFEELTAAVLHTLELHHRRQTDAGSLARMSVKCLLKLYTFNPQLVTPAVARMALRMHHLTLAAPTLNVIFSGTSYLDHDFGNLVRAKLAMPPPPPMRTVLRHRQAQEDRAAARAAGATTDATAAGAAPPPRRRTREMEARDLVVNMSTDTLRELLEFMDLPMVAGALK